MVPYTYNTPWSATCGPSQSTASPQRLQVETCPSQAGKSGFSNRRSMLSFTPQMGAMMTKTSLLPRSPPCSPPAPPPSPSPPSRAPRRRRHRHLLDVGGNHQRAYGERCECQAARPSMLGDARPAAARRAPTPMSTICSSSSAARAAPPARPQADHFIPAGLNAGPSLPLVSPAPGRAGAAGPTHAAIRSAAQVAGPDPDLLGLRRAGPAGPAVRDRPRPGSPAARCRRPWPTSPIRPMTPPSAGHLGHLRRMAEPARAHDRSRRTARWSARTAIARQLQPGDQFHAGARPGLPAADRAHLEHARRLGRGAARLAAGDRRDRLFPDGDGRARGPHDGDVELERESSSARWARSTICRPTRSARLRPAARAAAAGDDPVHGARRGRGQRSRPPR